MPSSTLVSGTLIYAVTVPNSFTTGSAIVAADVNANFTALAGQITTNEGTLGTHTTNITTNASNITTNTSNISTNGTNITANTSAENGTQVVYLKDEKASGTTGGTFTAFAWQTRDLNTIENPYGHTWVTGPSSNQFTLVAGTYEVFAKCPAIDVSTHKCKLRNITDSTDQVIGSSGHINPVAVSISYSTLSGLFNITKTTTFEIQHFSDKTRTNDGFGSFSADALPEIYTTVKIKRLSD